MAQTVILSNTNEWTQEASEVDRMPKPEAKKTGTQKQETIGNQERDKAYNRDFRCDDDISDPGENDGSGFLGCIDGDACAAGTHRLLLGHLQGSCG